jgi:ABC-type branched-subunit amino acid transport system ATPase component
MSLLALRAVDKIFGGLHAVRGVSFQVEQGAIFG